MKEQLISLETAKLAKKKGFGGPGLNTDYSWYMKKLINFPANNKCIFCEDFYSAPTQSLLQKWLRDKHGIFISINFIEYLETEDPEKEGDYWKGEVCKFDLYHCSVDFSMGYESTLEKCLELGLNLI